jgi:hypothetical protein
LDRQPTGQHEILNKCSLTWTIPATRLPKPLWPPPLQGENARLEELLLRRKAEVTVLTQRRVRLEQQLEHHDREARALRTAGYRLQVGTLGLRCNQNPQTQPCSRADMIKCQGEQVISNHRALIAQDGAT